MNKLGKAFKAPLLRRNTQLQQADEGLKLKSVE